MINSLQSLRGIFAIMIFLHHFPLSIQGGFAAGGACGVEFFLMLSGFVMCAGYEKRVVENNYHYNDFMLKRIIRVYPLHILCLCGFLIIRIFSLNIKELILLIPNILLLQSWIPLKSEYFSGNAVSWCLSDLMFFYAVFPFLVRETNLHRLRTLYIFIGIVISYFILINILPEKWWHFGIYIFPVSRLLDFFIGIILWQFYIKFRHRSFVVKLEHMSFICKTLIELLPLLLLTIMIITYPHISTMYTYCSYWWLPMIGIILILTIFNKMGGGISYLLNNKWLVIFGNVSFSFYMIHQLGIILTFSILKKVNLVVPVYISLPILFLLTVFISFIVYRYYETPIGNYLLAKIKKEMVKEPSVYDCSMIELPRIENRAGNITPIHPFVNIPFDIKRVFYSFDIPGGEARGAHAHKQCHQFLIAASGSFEVVLDDGLNKRTVLLNRPFYGLHIPPGIWASEQSFSSGSICLVLASEGYSEEDYIRDYNEFLKYRQL